MGQFEYGDAAYNGTPLQGGDPAFPGHPDFFDDSIHPSDPSYVRLAEHAVDEFYAQFLGQEPVASMSSHTLGLLALVLAGVGARRIRRGVRGTSPR